MLKRTPQTIHGPCRDQVEILPRHTLEHPVERRPLLTAVLPADSVVLEQVHNQPAVALCDGFELTLLVDRGLPISADADIECHSLCLAHRAVHYGAQSTRPAYRYQVYSIRPNRLVAALPVYGLERHLTEGISVRHLRKLAGKT